MVDRGFEADICALSGGTKLDAGLCCRAERWSSLSIVVRGARDIELFGAVPGRFGAPKSPSIAFHSIQHPYVARWAPPSIVRTYPVI
jgi:hypothetical protein